VDGAPPGRSVMATILWNSLSFLPSFSLFLSLSHWSRKHNRIKKEKKKTRCKESTKYYISLRLGDPLR
jgi:hypothetical protein